MPSSLSARSKAPEQYAEPSPSLYFRFRMHLHYPNQKSSSGGERGALPEVSQTPDIRFLWALQDLKGPPPSSRRCLRQSSRSPRGV